MAYKMRVKFPLYYSLSRLEPNADLFQFHGQELDGFPVKIHQADICSLGAHSYKIFLNIQDRCVKIPLGRGIYARHRIRSRYVGKREE